MSVRVAVPPLVGAVLAGCSAPDPAPPPPTQPPSVVKAPEDSGLRPVTMTYPDGFAYAPEETAAQALCHALSREEWSDLLGGDVGRTVRFDGGTACVAIRGGLTVEAAMIGGPVTDTAGGPADVAGHRAWLSPSEDGRSARAAAEVGPPGPRPACADAPRFDGTSGKRDDLDDMLRKLLATLLTRLAPDGPVTPVEDSYGHVPLRPTPPVPGVRLSDLPRRVQGLVLCTAMANTAPGGYWTDRFGQCVSDDLGRRAVVTHRDTDAGLAKFIVGGRPARFDPLGGTVSIDLAELPDGVTASRRGHVRPVGAGLGRRRRGGRAGVGGAARGAAGRALTPSAGRGSGDGHDTRKT